VNGPAEHAAKHAAAAEPKKIAYLFGAGATHAELDDLGEDLIENGHGLLIRDVSKRVIEEARSNNRYLKGVELVSATSGSLNIELLISLIENSKIHRWEYKAELLKKLVQRDIGRILTPSRIGRFRLHKGLFELHNHTLTRAKEELIGLISLNYDDVLDQAYKEFLGKPNYCFSLEQDTQRQNRLPLLKLHGSFNWKRRRILTRFRTIDIIPLGSSKSYLHPPYGHIWNRALEILAECDTLRVIGCSLSQNDFHLIDLLFKAHLERAAAFEIEIINSEEVGQNIRANYGFFDKITTLENLERHLIADTVDENRFKTWLKYKSRATLGDHIEGTRYLSMI